MPASVQVASVNNAPTESGNGSQAHIIYAVNGALWWAFWFDANDLTLIRCASSPDLVTWTARTSATVTSQSGADGRAMSVAYANISSNDVIIVNHKATGGAGESIRATMSGTTITWGSDVATETGGADPSGDGAAFGTDGSHWASGTNSGNLRALKSTNTDSGTSWTTGFAAGVTVFATAAFSGSTAIIPLASGNMLYIGDNGSSNKTWNNLRYAKWTTSWAASAAIRGTNVGTSQNPADWAWAKLSNTDIHVMMRTGASTWEHFRWNGTTFSAGDTVGNLATAGAQGVALVSDGVNVWAFTIASASGNDVYVNKWTSGTGWAGWTAQGLASATRNKIGAYQATANATICVYWTEGTGSPYTLQSYAFALGTFFTYTPASGGIAFGGAATTGASHAFSYSPADGGLAVGGAAATEVHETIRTYTPSTGGLAIGGAADTIGGRIRTYSPADGGIAVGGDTATTSKDRVFTYVPTGGVALGGDTAPLAVTKQYAPASGGIAIGGAAPTELHQTIRTYTPSDGGLAVGGAAVTFRHRDVYTYTPPSGAIALGGGVGVFGQQHVFTYTASSGGVALGGGTSGTLASHTYAYTPGAGGLALSGAASTNPSRSFEIQLHVLLANRYSREIPISVTLAARMSRAVPLTVVLQPVITVRREIPITVVLQPIVAGSREIPLTVILQPIVAESREIPITVVLQPIVASSRSIPLTVVLYPIVTGLRTVPLTVVLQPITSGSREIPISVGLQPIIGNQQRTVPISVVLLETAAIEIPISVVLTSRIRIPLRVVFPIMSFRWIPLSVVLARTRHRTIPLSTVTGVKDGTRTVPISVVLAVRARRTIPLTVVLATIVNGSRHVPITVELQAQQRRRRIPLHVLLGGASIRWNIDSPQVYTDVPPDVNVDREPTVTIGAR